MSLRVMSAPPGMLKRAPPRPRPRRFEHAEAAAPGDVRHVRMGSSKRMSGLSLPYTSMASCQVMRRKAFQIRYEEPF
jgi:hypothetical protein